MVVTIIVFCVLILSVTLYSVGKYKHKRKNIRGPPQSAMRRWGHNDGNDYELISYQLYDFLS